MDEATSFNTTKRQTINPMVDEINKLTEPLYKSAMKELGYTVPLYVRIYNQIRFYEDYGKLGLGVSVVSKDALAKQFDVTISQIDGAYNNLTNIKKLGRWVTHAEPVFRNVTRTWCSNVRLARNMDSNVIRVEAGNSNIIRAELLQHKSKTLTALELVTDKPPLSESNKKVSEILLSKDSSQVAKQLDAAHMWICVLFGKNTNRYKLTPKRKQKLKLRLKELGADGIKNAFNAIYASDFHRGDNDRGWKIDDDPYWVLDNAERAEKWSNLSDSQKASDNNRNRDLTKLEIKDVK